VEDAPKAEISTFGVVEKRIPRRYCSFRGLFELGEKSEDLPFVDVVISEVLQESSSSFFFWLPLDVRLLMATMETALTTRVICCWWWG
jgi:hypothetical protein